MCGRELLVRSIGVVSAKGTKKDEVKKLRGSPTASRGPEGPPQTSCIMSHFPGSEASVASEVCARQDKELPSGRFCAKWPLQNSQNSLAFQATTVTCPGLNNDKG